MSQVLSILSHVVHGYVGNRAITFPLQYLGWNVDALNTTNFSNHPGYGKFGGSAESPALIQKVLEGLEHIGNLGGYNMVISGYAPNVEILESIRDSVLLRLYQQSKPIIVVDPILGDNGKMYVQPEVVPVYREILASGIVDLITPNQFEFEVLSGVEISDIPTLKQAIAEFNGNFNVKNIVISSINIGSDMYSVGYSGSRLFLVPISEIPCKFFGGGDLFTALISHRFYQNGLTVEVLKDTILKLTKVLENTLEIERKTNPDTKIINDIKIIPLAPIFAQDFTSAAIPIKYID